MTSTRLRLALLAALLLGLVAAARWTPLGAYLAPAAIRAGMQEAGALGAAVFVAAFVAGELAHIPGLVFVAIAVVAYGRVFGGLLAFGAALTSVAVSFVVVRSVGGQALAEVKSDLMRRLLQPIERRPVRTIVLLRTVFWLAPPLNYALALSPVRFRDYMAGSALGLVAPLGAAVLLFERLL